MTSLSEILTAENQLFSTYIFYCCLLIFKTSIMSLLTTRQRFKTRAFANPEDAGRRLKVREDGNVERIRRAHRNDLENIPIFFVASFGYILTNPPLATAVLLFRVFTIARYLHTLVYAIFVVPQPTRAIVWGAGYLTTGYMAVRTILHFL